MESKILTEINEFIGHSFSVIRRDVVFSTGESASFQYIDRSDVALIIPILSDSELLVINQYRSAVGRFIWEFPAGKRVSNESIEETALRELAEETGYT